MRSKLTDFIFVSPPGREVSTFQQHLGTAYLCAVTHEAGMITSQYVSEKNPSVPRFLEFVLDAKPLAVGFTVYESNLHHCCRLVQALREVAPNIFVVLGGPSATFSPLEVLEMVPAHICLRGAGEGTIVHLIEALADCAASGGLQLDAFSNIPNLVIQAGDHLEFTHQASLSSFPGDYFSTLDDIPSPYAKGIIQTIDVGILTARGCNQRCTYCSFASISGRRVVFHSVDRVLDDIAILKQIADTKGLRRSDAVSFFDDTLTINRNRAKLLCEGIVDHNLQLPYSAMTRADHLDAELIRLMKQAGFRSIGFGLESAVPRVLRAIGKVSNPKDPDTSYSAEREYLESIKKSVRLAREAGIIPYVSIIAGLPLETESDQKTTLEFVSGLDLDYYVHNYLQILPGTPLFENYQEYGIRVEKTSGEGFYRTVYTYDVRQVSPLPISHIHLAMRREAEMITDALCGRPNGLPIDDNGTAWAAILHPGVRIEHIAPWLRTIIGIGGLVLVIDSDNQWSGTSRDFPSRSLLPKREWNLAADFLIVLARNGMTGESGCFQTLSTFVKHIFRFANEQASLEYPSLKENPDGGYEVSIAIVGNHEMLPERLSAVRNLLAQRKPIQVADNCRWWGGWPRCEKLHVLHIHEDGTIRACWNGPVLGLVGDSHAQLRKSAIEILKESNGGSGPLICPIATPIEKSDMSLREDAATAELRAKLAWVQSRA